MQCACGKPIAFTERNKHNPLTLEDSDVVLIEDLEMPDEEAEHFSTLDVDEKAETKIMQLAEQEGSVDEPLCVACVTKLRQRQERVNEEISREMKLFQEFLRDKHYEQVLKDYQSDDDKTNNTEKQIQQLNDRLGLVDMTRGQKLSELESLIERKNECDLLSEHFWTEIRTYQVKIADSLKCIHASKKAVKNLDDQMAFQNQFNLLNLTFNISSDGDIPTFNGLRLGKLQSEPVSWMEINAALGVVVHLVSILAEHYNVPFKHCKPSPMGSFSKMVIIRTPSDGSAKNILSSEFDLFISNKSDSKVFDVGLVCLLQCIKELSQALELKFQHPISITKATVGGNCIKLSGNPDAEWTRAFKCLAIDLRQLMQK